MDNYTSSISQREVDIFFGCVSSLLKRVAAAASAGSFLNIESITIGFSTGQSFKVGVDRIVYNHLDDPKFMISIPYEVKNE